MASHSLKKQASLPSSFYLDDDVVRLSQALIGKKLFTHLEGETTGGIIVETEAYRGAEDRACHAYQNRRTARTEVMFREGGVAYVYLCYGIHSLLNVVTNKKGIPHAILIRALEPITGIEVMLKRRGKEKIDRTLLGGPGALTEALGITRDLNGASLSGPAIWIEEGEEKGWPIVASPRVGVAYAKEDALLPWRFRVEGSPWTSPASS